MELRHLESLTEVVRCGGFSAAAKQLGTTQPTISKAIGLLEHECGAKLLERLSDGVRATDAGAMVLRRAKTILAERDALQAELAGLQGLETGRLRLGIPTLGSSVLFAPMVAAYHQRYPGIEVELREQGSRDLEELLRSGEIDMGATLDPVPDDLEWMLFVDEPLVALLPKAHPLASRDSVRFKELAQNPFILFERGFVLNLIVAKASRQRGIHLNVASRGAHADFIIALVSTGLGVSLLPRLEVASRGNLSIETALIDEADMRWRLGLMWRKNAALPPAALRWIELVAEYRDRGLLNTTANTH